MGANEWRSGKGFVTDSLPNRYRVGLDTVAQAGHDLARPGGQSQVKIIETFSRESLDTV
jgi:hypothetical protein